MPISMRSSARRAVLSKCAEASLAGDTAGALLTAALPGGGHIDSLGSMIGLIGEPDDADKGNSALSFIPGVGAYRLGNRIRQQLAKQRTELGVDGTRHMLGELFTPALHTGVSAAIGGLAGHLAGKATGRRGFSSRGALAGAALGASASVAGAIAAAIARRRTAREQADHDRGSSLGTWFVPGVATYNKWKRLGRSQGDIEEARAKKKK